MARGRRTSRSVCSASGSSGLNDVPFYLLQWYVSLEWLRFLPSLSGGAPCDLAGPDVHASALAMPPSALLASELTWVPIHGPLCKVSPGL